MKCVFVEPKVGAGAGVPGGMGLWWGLAPAWCRVGVALTVEASSGNFQTSYRVSSASHITDIVDTVRLVLPNPAQSSAASEDELLLPYGGIGHFCSKHHPYPAPRQCHRG